MTMFSQLILFLFVGFAVSYAFNWLFQLVQDPQISATPPVSQSVRHAVVLGLFFAAGPFVLARETLDAQSRGEWPDSYLAGGYALSAVWSVVIGFAVTQIVIG